jgi:YHS domain-containing protein
MKQFLILFFVGLTFAVSAQQVDYNDNGKYIAKGYDVVAYFSGKAIAGNIKYAHLHNGTKFKFANQANLDTFKSNPKKYIPEYGGYCAYAMGKTGDKVSINPKSFEIRDEKLYLFYCSFGVNTLKKWNKENPTFLKAKADKNWMETKLKQP